MPRASNLRPSGLTISGTSIWTTVFSGAHLRMKERKKRSAGARVPGSEHAVSDVSRELAAGVGHL